MWWTNRPVIRKCVDEGVLAGEARQQVLRPPLHSLAVLPHQRRGPSLRHLGRGQLRVENGERGDAAPHQPLTQAAGGQFDFGSSGIGPMVAPPPVARQREKMSVCLAEQYEIRSSD